MICTYYIWWHNVHSATSSSLYKQSCVYYSRYIYVCMLSYLFAFTGQSFDPRLHWQVSNLFSAARILCVLISSAVVTTTNSTTTFICSEEDAPRKNVHCIHYQLQIWDYIHMYKCTLYIVYVLILKLPWCR